MKRLFVSVSIVVLFVLNLQPASVTAFTSPLPNTATKAQMLSPLATPTAPRAFAFRLPFTIRLIRMY